VKRKISRSTFHHSYEEESSKDNEEEDDKEGKEIKEVTKIDSRKQPSRNAGCFSMV
jgi:hypothetical protein